MTPFRDTKEGVIAKAGTVNQQLQIVLREKEKLAARCSRVTAVVDLQAQFADASMQDAAIWNKGPFVKGVISGSLLGFLCVLLSLL